ncbi:MAG: calcium-binding protein, partial [Richelia sp. SM2_1_7]|nr:calcium-binding protein [Richelia sp. SM2_1_7]
MILLIGGAGNDNLYGGEGNDSIDGGDGIDTLRETADTDFTLSDGTLQSTVTGTDTFSNIQRVVLTGGDGANIINASGYGGSAFLYGRDGDDTLIGGAGNDNLYGGEGDDSIDGGDGIDTLRETADTDFTLSDSTLQSTVTGTDTFTNIERVALTGGDGANIINASGYGGSAFLYGRDGDDTLIGGAGNDNLYGG